MADATETTPDIQALIEQVRALQESCVTSITIDEVLYALVDALEQFQWRDIYDAPKDGTVIWLRLRSGRVIEVSWRTEDDREPAFVGAVCGLEYPQNEWSFTHWRLPLPPPPKREG